MRTISHIYRKKKINASLVTPLRIFQFHGDVGCILWSPPGVAGKSEVAAQDLHFCFAVWEIVKKRLRIQFFEPLLPCLYPIIIFFLFTKYKFYNLFWNPPLHLSTSSKINHMNLEERKKMIYFFINCLVQMSHTHKKKKIFWKFNLSGGGGSPRTSVSIREYFQRCVLKKCCFWAYALLETLVCRFLPTVPTNFFPL